MVESRTNLFAWSDEIKPVRQHSAYTCGPASLSYCFQLLDLTIPEQEISAEISPEPGEGVEWLHLVDFLIEYNLDFSYHRNKSFDDLLRVQQLYQSPILIQWYSQRIPDTPGYHASVVKAIDESEVVLMDPTFRDYFPMSRKEFELAWKDGGGESSFLVVHPGQILEPPLHSQWSLETYPHPGHKGKYTANAAALAYALRLLGRTDLTVHDVEDNLNIKQDQTRWLDFILNTVEYGFGAALHTQRDYQSLLEAFGAFRSPIIVRWKPRWAHGHVEAAVVLSMDQSGIWLMDPGLPDFQQVKRAQFEARWRDADGDQSFLILQP